VAKKPPAKKQTPEEIEAEMRRLREAQERHRDRVGNKKPKKPQKNHIKNPQKMFFYFFLILNFL
jgi:hypothetical protein